LLSELYCKRVNFRWGKVSLIRDQWILSLFTVVYLDQRKWYISAWRCCWRLYEWYNTAFTWTYTIFDWMFTRS
jgi:hypothetical protein